ncbi:phage baseplate assembly protein V [Actinoplanes sp. NPDC051861]|uniref:phage baseplate assembly protein V n=1 Tax=Actinoplanes sp. NPDC051861 TaxID=3155170 RepID=UPI0034268924
MQPHGNGIVIGTVTSLKDDKNRNRVEVELAHVGGQRRWCRMVSMMAGSSRGAVFTPEKGDEVLVAYREGCPEDPYILGGVWGQTDKRPADDGDPEKNNWRFFTSRSGHVFRFDDTAGKERIELIAKDGKQKVVIDSTGKITVACEKGDVDVTATDGRATVQAKNVSVTAKDDLLIEAGGTITIRGRKVDINP